MFNRPAARLIWLCAVIAGGTGCVPDLPVRDNPPEAITPTSFRGVDDNSPAAAAASSATIPWSDFFADPTLNSLVNEALDNNQELNILMRRIEMANNEVYARSGEYLPKVEFGAGIGIDKVGEYTSQGVNDATAEYAPGKEVPKNLQNYGAAFRASWEVDIWKKLRNATKQASLEYLATIEGRNFLATQLVAEIASGYYELLALDRQLAVVENNIAIQEDALEIMRLEKQAARVTELAVKRFEAEILKNRSRIFELRQQIIATENRLNFLAGRAPQPVLRDPGQFNATDEGVIAVGTPAELYENRPDIKQAELELEASKLGVAVARARFYPSLSLDAALGHEAFYAKYFFTSPESMLYNLAASLAVPVLNRRAIEAEFKSADARQLEALYHYQQTLLTAVTEVSNQVASLQNLAQSYSLKDEQVARLNESVEVSNRLFQSARADYMEVLLTRRDVLDAEMELIETRKQQWIAKVNLYQALGGGWR